MALLSVFSVSSICDPLHVSRRAAPSEADRQRVPKRLSTVGTRLEMLVLFESSAKKTHLYFTKRAFKYESSYGQCILLSTKPPKVAASRPRKQTTFSYRVQAFVAGFKKRINQ